MTTRTEGAVSERRVSRRALVLGTGTLGAAALLRAGGARADVVPVFDGKRPERAKPRMSADVVAVMDEQAARWTAGDLEGFCAHYAEDAIFVSPSGRTDGRQAVLDRYKKRYPDKAAMGALRFEILSARGDDRVASVVLRWHLTYGDKPEASGFSVVGFEKQKGRWLLIHDASM